ncbi:carboxypeptidase-like regulatory domain-containing protein, partial [Autumnicola musiva]
MTFIIKSSIILFIILGLSKANGQNNKKINIEFKNQSLQQVISLIEDNSNYIFYYETKWLGTKLYEGDYKNEAIHVVLDSLLKQTTLNYFLDGQKVILTNNTKIIPTLSENFFQDSLDSKDNNPPEAPMFKEEYAKLIKSRPSGKEIISIGKEDNSTNKKFYTISGFVLNSENNLPIEDVAIYVSDRSRSTITNETGYFKIRLPKGYYQIETSILGYNKIVQPILV